MDILNPGDPEDTAALVKRILEGDPTAGTELLERFAPAVYAAIRRNGGQSAVDDLSQQTILIVLEKIGADELRDPTKLGQFMRAIARNITLRFAKRSRRKVEMDPGWTDKRIDPASNPYEQLLEKEEVAIARAVFDQMPRDRDREVLRRFYGTSESKEEICAALELSSRGFDKVISRARARFRKLYRKKIGS